MTEIIALWLASGALVMFLIWYFAKQGKQMYFTLRDFFGGYETVSRFLDGYSIVKTTKGCGVVKGWKILIPCIYKDITRRNGCFVVVLHDKKALFSLDGKELLPLKYDNISASPVPGRFFALTRGMTGWFDAVTAKFLLPCEYSSMRVDEGYLLAKKGIYYAIFGLDGTKIVPTEEKITQMFRFLSVNFGKTPYLIIKRGDGTGLAGAAGIVIEPIYPRIEEVYGNSAVISSYNKWGLIRFDGTEILPADKIRRIGIYANPHGDCPAIYEVVEEDKSYLINEKGQIFDHEMLDYAH